MKHFSNISMLTLAIIMASCSSEEEIKTLQPEKGGSGLVAQAEGLHSDSRITFTTDGFFWSDGDELSVSLTGKNYFDCFALEDGAGKTSGAFYGLTEDGILNYAVYPYSDNNKITGDELTYTYPAEYEYSQVDEVVPTSAVEGTTYNSIMVPLVGKIASIEKSTKVQLKHLGGMVRIIVAKMPSVAGDFIFEADKNITGEYKADLTALEPILKGIGTGNKVTIHYQGGKKDGNGIFYIPVPVGEYTNFTLAFDANKDSENDFEVSVDTPKSVSRAGVQQWYLSSQELGGGDKVKPEEKPETQPDQNAGA